ncbi:hypothetical protein F2Q70_00015980 [Brassica cretica]|uniref:Uncharacterized protein n=1 Tax=Brassica cretica TaxID=69181 RepID=A0A8S9HWG9_BRACR|nr:hypothetical protein F2Q70_00015980 [Brassica cretica]
MIGSPTPSCSEKILLLVLSKRNAGVDVEGFDLVSRSFLASVATCPVGVAVALAISFPNKELGTANGLLWFEMLEGSSLRLVRGCDDFCCGGSDVVVASYFSSKAAAFVVVAGLMCKAAMCFRCGWTDVVGVFYSLVVWYSDFCGLSF